MPDRIEDQPALAQEAMVKHTPPKDIHDRIALRTV